MIPGILMGSVKARLGLAMLLVALSSGVTGCFLDVYQTAETVAPGELAFWCGLGVILSPGFQFAGVAPQLHVRYGLAPKLDIGLGSGLSIQRGFEAKFLGVMGDLRYQLNGSPDVSLGIMPGNFPFFGEVLSVGTLYISQSFGSLTPYGAYRLWLLWQGGDFSLSHQVTLGVQIFNQPKLPAIFEISWKDGRLMIGFALRL